MGYIDGEGQSFGIRTYKLEKLKTDIPEARSILHGTWDKPPDSLFQEVTSALSSQVTHPPPWREGRKPDVGFPRVIEKEQFTGRNLQGLWSWKTPQTSSGCVL